MNLTSNYENFNKVTMAAYKGQNALEKRCGVMKENTARSILNKIIHQDEGNKRIVRADFPLMGWTSKKSLENCS